MEKLLSTTGEVLASYRKNSGLSLKDMADKLGTSYQYYSKIEKNEKSLSKKSFELFIELFNVSEKDIFNIELYEEFKRSGPKVRTLLVESLMKIKELEAKIKEDELGTRIYKRIKEIEKIYE